MDLRTSDHKPVSAWFEATKVRACWCRAHGARVAHSVPVGLVRFPPTQVKVYHKDQQAEVQMAIVRDLDKFENECMPGTLANAEKPERTQARTDVRRLDPAVGWRFLPDAELSTNLVEFGKVKYLVPTIATVTLVNVGQVRKTSSTCLHARDRMLGRFACPNNGAGPTRAQVLLQYKFIPKPTETKFAKPGMSISPEMGLLVPGSCGWQNALPELGSSPDGADF